MADRWTHERGDSSNKKGKSVMLGDVTWASPLSSLLRAKEVCAGEEGAAAAEGGGTVLERFEDPRAVFPDEVMMIVLDKLDVSSIAAARVVNSEWLTEASADKIWEPKCLELWQGKAHIPRIAKVAGLSKMKATSLSIMDARRNRITRNDMCDHAWEFHFNQGAPFYFRSLDPYWGAHGPPMKRYFHLDGSITRPDDNVWTGHEDSFTIVTGDGDMGEHYVRIDAWPQMSVVRKPDWGWELSNDLYCFTSIPDATDDDKVDGTGPS